MVRSWCGAGVVRSWCGADLVWYGVGVVWCGAGVVWSWCGAELVWHAVSVSRCCHTVPFHVFTLLGYYPDIVLVLCNAGMVVNGMYVYGVCTCMYVYGAYGGELVSTVFMLTSVMNVSGKMSFLICGLVIPVTVGGGIWSVVVTVGTLLSFLHTHYWQW